MSKLLRWIANDLLVVFQEVIHNLLHIGSTQTLSRAEAQAIFKLMSCCEVGYIEQLHLFPLGKVKNCSRGLQMQNNNKEAPLSELGQTAI